MAASLGRKDSKNSDVNLETTRIIKGSMDVDGFAASEPKKELEEQRGQLAAIQEKITNLKPGRDPVNLIKAKKSLEKKIAKLEKEIAAPDVKAAKQDKANKAEAKDTSIDYNNPSHIDAMLTEAKTKKTSEPVDRGTLNAEISEAVERGIQAEEMHNARSKAKPNKETVKSDTSKADDIKVASFKEASTPNTQSEKGKTRLHENILAQVKKGNVQEIDGKMRVAISPTYVIELTPDELNGLKAAISEKEEAPQVTAARAVSDEDIPTLTEQVPEPSHETKLKTAEKPIPDDEFDESLIPIVIERLDKAPQVTATQAVSDEDIPTLTGQQVPEPSHETKLETAEKPIPDDGIPTLTDFVSEEEFAAGNAIAPDSAIKKQLQGAAESRNKELSELATGWGNLKPSQVSDDSKGLISQLKEKKTQIVETVGKLPDNVVSFMKAKQAKVQAKVAQVKEQGSQFVQNAKKNFASSADKTNVKPTAELTDTRYSDMKKHLSEEELEQKNEELGEKLEAGDMEHLGTGGERVGKTVLTPKEANELSDTSIKTKTEQSSELESSAPTDAETLRQEQAASIRANGENMAFDMSHLAEEIERAKSIETPESSPIVAEKTSADEMAELDSTQYETSAKDTEQSSSLKSKVAGLGVVEKLKQRFTKAEKSSQERSEPAVGEETQMVAAEEASQEMATEATAHIAANEPDTKEAATPTNLAEVNAEIDELINNSFADPEHVKAVLKAAQEQDVEAFQSLTQPPVNNEELRQAAVKSFASDLASKDPVTRQDQLDRLGVREEELEQNAKNYFDEGQHIKQLTADPRSFFKTEEAQRKMFTAEGKKGMQMGGAHYAPTEKLAALLHKQREVLSMEIQEDTISSSEPEIISSPDDERLNSENYVTVSEEGLGKSNLGLDENSRENEGRESPTMA